MSTFEGILEIYSQNKDDLRNIRTEATTIDVLIKPMLEILGYDSRTRKKLEREFGVDVKGKNGQKVDIVLKNAKGEIIMLVECKSITEKVEIRELAQLKAYFNNDRELINHAKFAILTNGLEWKFYTDIETPNVLDSKPFFEFNIASMNSETLKNLEKFSHDNFDANVIRKFAESSKYITLIKSKLVENYRSPSEEFIQFFQAFLGWIVKGGKINDEYFNITKSAFMAFVDDIVLERVREKEIPKSLVGNELEKLK